VSERPVRVLVVTDHSDATPEVLQAIRDRVAQGPEQAAGGRVIGSVSIRNDPYDAVEETLLDEPIDEFIVALHPHGLTRALHLDLPHRLAHFRLPVSVVVTPG